MFEAFGEARLVHLGKGEDPFARFLHLPEALLTSFAFSAIDWSSAGMSLKTGHVEVENLKDSYDAKSGNIHMGLKSGTLNDINVIPLMPATAFLAVLLVSGIRCGPSDQEMAGSVLIAFPVAIGLGLLLFGALFKRFRGHHPDVRWSRTPTLVALGVCAVVAAVTAGLMMDTNVLKRPSLRCGSSRPPISR